MNERRPIEARQVETLASAPSRLGPELQQLLDAISSGAIVDVGELEENDLEQLRAYARDDESVQALLDRLRGFDSGEA